jgi:hypothetical protein
MYQQQQTWPAERPEETKADVEAKAATTTIVARI